MKKVIVLMLLVFILTGCVEEAKSTDLLAKPNQEWIDKYGTNQTSVEHYNMLLNRALLNKLAKSVKGGMIETANQLDEIRGLSNHHIVSEEAIETGGGK